MRCVTFFLFGLMIGPFTGVAFARSIPVYLKPESPIPSGHYSRDWLARNTRQLQIQTWHQVTTSSGQKGWVRASDLYSPLYMARTAKVTERAPLRKQPRLDETPAAAVDEGTQVEFLDQGPEWSLVIIPSWPLGPSYWIENHALAPDTKAEPTAILKTKTEIYHAPRLTTKSVATLGAGAVVTILADKGEWLDVEYRNQRGFARRTNLLTSQDFAAQGLFVRSASSFLRKDPAPEAPVIRRLSRLEKVTLTESRTEKWGEAILGKDTLWWQIKEIDLNNPAPPSTQAKIMTPATGNLLLSTKELFERRIFDMASSPVTENLMFASAQGVFRSVDGKQWTRIEMFKDQNLPIAITAKGTIFIGPYRSDDQGQTFQNFIRWDHLTATVRKNWMTTGQFRLLEIKLPSGNEDEVVLLMDVGHSAPVLISTRDQGITWGKVEAKAGVGH